jgi:anthranilate/para-aminobenzoate synthase component II
VYPQNDRHFSVLKRTSIYIFTYRLKSQLQTTTNSKKSGIRDFEGIKRTGFDRAAIAFLIFHPETFLTQGDMKLKSDGQVISRS